MGASAGSTAGESAPSDPPRTDGTASASSVPLLLSWLYVGGDPEVGNAKEEPPPPPITMADLPPLKPRETEYWTEMGHGILIVLGICSALVAFCYSVVGIAEKPSFAENMFCLECCWACVSLLCTTYIFFGQAGEIRRSAATCFPIPQEVEKRLRRGDSFDRCINIKGADDSHTHGSYCVRCFVWRPADSTSFAGKTHHCSTCQRCYRGFDHHCNVFGRCIVNGNMPCFWLNIGMLWAGLLTAGVAFVGSVGDGPFPEEAAGLAMRMTAAAVSSILDN